MSSCDYQILKSQVLRHMLVFLCSQGFWPLPQHTYIHRDRQTHTHICKWYNVNDRRHHRHSWNINVPEWLENTLAACCCQFPLIAGGQPGSWQFPNIDLTAMEMLYCPGHLLREPGASQGWRWCPMHWSSTPDRQNCSRQFLGCSCHSSWQNKRCFIQISSPNIQNALNF